jgi:hypothetical protein
VRPPSSRQRREFGLLVGGALVALAVWVLLRRHRPAAAAPLAATGVLLSALGAFAPDLLAGPYRAWMALSRAAGWLTTRVLLALVYFVVLTPIGIIRRLSGADPLARRDEKPPTNWRPYPEGHGSRTHYEKMY